MSDIMPYSAGDDSDNNTQSASILYYMQKTYPLLQQYSVSSLTEMNSLANQSVFGNGKEIDYGILFEGHPHGEIISYNYSLVYNETSPFSLLVLSHTVLQSILQSTLKKQAMLFEFCHPLLPVNAGEVNNVFLLFGPLLLQYGFVFMTPLFSILIIGEKDKRIKDYLYLNSLSPLVYWGGTFLADYITFLIPSIITLIVFNICKIPAFYDNSPIGGIALFLAFGLACIPLGYVLSLVFDKEETANKWLYALFSVLTVIPYLVFQVLLANVGGQEAPYWVHYIISIFPPYAFYRGITILAKTGSSLPLTAYDLFNFKNEDNIISLIFIILLDAAFYSTILMAVELRWFKRFFKAKTKIFYSDEARDSIIIDTEDETEKQEEVEVDVVNEAKRVKRSQNDLVWVKDLSKVYTFNQKRKTAVNGVTFGVSSGECFGLLGPNGAGKTTLLSMISGLLDIDGGQASAYTTMGFCPQRDILLDSLTVAEHLDLFGIMKGVPSADRQQQTEDLIQKFALQEYSHRKAGELSGGNKRKLSAAISMVGNPSVIFMDEPSTGMDAVSRRFMWDVITEMKEGRAIILSTHSMEEADRLCNRISILVRGNLRCIGTSQHLKNKYGSGYTIVVKASFEQAEIIGAKLKEEFPEVERVPSAIDICYEIPQEGVRLSKIFKTMEKMKQANEVIEYVVSQTSLEQVFLRFANEQLEETLYTQNRVNVVK
eukprot:TRINITY_DN5088_c0_g1_i1.p1 TRINITY_DN5088_c0_g1~~TRINITY_DN5088_c0_g1_i1.p1  ORF type:complete len:787 (-),score=127.35 TRINITY_DN5088_c0_g1_i1:88-2226(-)